jgi:hypothetical protein
MVFSDFKSMKINTVALFIGLLIHVSSISAQKFEVLDTVSQNKTIYTQINDSVYGVQSFFKNKLVASGKIIHPDLKSHFEFPKIYLVNYNLKLLKYQLTDTCEDFNIFGVLQHKYFIQNRQVVKHWQYWPHLDKHLHSYYESIGPETVKIEYNEKGKIIYKETKIDKKRIDYEIKIGDKNYKYHFNYNDSTKRYTNLGKKDYEFYSRYKINTINTYSKKGHLLTQKQNFNQKGQLLQETTFEYNRNKQIIETTKTEYIESIKYSITNTKYLYNENNKLIEESQTYNYIKDNIKIENYNWKRDFKTKTIFCKNNQLDDKLVFNENQFILTHSFRTNKNYNFDKNGHVFLKRRLYQNTIYNYKQFEKQDYNKTVQLIVALTHYHYNNVNLLKDIKLSHIVQSDSFFNFQNQLTDLHVKHKDTFVRYKIIDNKKQIIYHSHYLRIAKDILACKEGLKTLNNEWLVFKDPKAVNKFDLLECIYNDSNTLYIGHNDEKISIIDWRGNVILDQIERLKSEYVSHFDEQVPIMIYLSDSMRQVLNLKLGLLFWVSNEKKNEYKLIAENGKTILEFPGHFYPFETLKNGNLGPKIGAIEKAENQWHLIDFKGNMDSTVFQSIGSVDKFISVFIKKQHYFLDNKYKIISNSNYYSIKHRKENYLWLQDEADGNKLFNLETSQVEKRIPYNFFTLFHNSYAMVRDESGNLGLYTHSMQEFIPVKYKQINNFNRYYMAQNYHDLDIYLPDSGFVKTVHCDTIYNLTYNFNHNYDYINDFKVIKKNNLYGLLDLDFNTVIEPIYSEILKTNKDLIFITPQGNIDFYFNITDKMKYQMKYPTEHAMPFKTLFGIKNLSGYIDYQGNFIEDNDYNFIQSNRFKLTVIRQNNKPIGLVNCLGEKVKDLNEYKEIFEYSDLIYILDKEEKIGVLSAEGQEIIKPEYYYINYYPEMKILWYIDKYLSRNSYNYDIYKNNWKLKDLKNNNSFTDTFAFPIYFKKNHIGNKYGVFENTHNQFGFLVQTPQGIKKLIDAKYTHNYSIDEKLIAFHSENLGTKIIDTDSFISFNLPYEKVMKLNSGEFLALKGTNTYLLDSIFQIKDSSTSYFTDKNNWLNYSESIFFYDDDEDISQTQDDEENDVMLIPGKPNRSVLSIDSKETQKPLHNLSVCIYLLQPKLRDKAELNNNFYPRVNIEGYGYNHYYENFHDIMPQTLYVRWPNVSIANVESIKKPEYQAYPFSFYSIYNYKDIYFKCFSKKTMTLLTNTINDRNYQFLHIYCDSIQSYLFNLSDLLIIEKMTKFNQIVAKKLIQIDKKDMPCFVTHNYYELFNDQFALQGDNIRFYLGEGYNYYIEMPLKDFESVMKPFWKTKLLN